MIRRLCLYPEPYSSWKKPEKNYTDNDPSHISYHIQELRVASRNKVLVDFIRNSKKSPQNKGQESFNWHRCSQALRYTEEEEQTEESKFNEVGQFIVGVKIDVQVRALWGEKENEGVIKYCREKIEDFFHEAGIVANEP